MDTSISSNIGSILSADTRIIDVKLNELVEAIFAKISNLSSMAKQNSPDDFLSADEVAQMLRIKRSTLYALTSNRDIPYFTPCKNNLFRRRDVVAYIEAHAKPSRNQISEQALAELVEKGNKNKTTRRISRRDTTWTKSKTA